MQVFAGRLPSDNAPRRAPERRRSAGRVPQVSFWGAVHGFAPMLRSKVFLLPLALLAFGCGKVVDEAHAEERAAPKPTPAASAKPAGAEHAAADEGGPR